MGCGIVAETFEPVAHRHATEVDYERNDEDQDPVAAELFLFRCRDIACGMVGANAVPLSSKRLEPVEVTNPQCAVLGVRCGFRTSSVLVDDGWLVDDV